MKKKGETIHHLSYKPEITAKIPSRGSHLILTSFSSMKPTEKNIEYLKWFERAVRLIRWEKESKL